MRIVIAEDSVLLRAGLTRILIDAGEDVVATVGDADELRTTVARHQPDLALVDFRLPENLTGIDALQALRSHWSGTPLPAIMITGSSLGGHEDQALTHDYHLLIKPVLPNKLRAMIAFKLGMR